eukprot:CAMPEP_0197737604 /NCGR_PEP_ID=MMETSP1435-20131217/9932_1 /TAXON_ID=426625 /ORGANISM="Chaetoceros brevis, Strain CCMP164" /LENGTH=124 /DNA_ID=CAMNT_0043326177 /DNA_START=16 /DNA_END=390 /DNA_ORIENTATION=+
MTRPAFYSCNDNQNFFVNEGKTSSRVLNPPGGRSSINLKWCEGEKGEINVPDMRRFGKDAVNDGADSQQSNRSDETSNSNSSRSLESNSTFANGNNMNGGNALTDRPSFRVLHPPGGKSTIFLG